MNCSKCKKDLNNIKSATVNNKDYCIDCLKCYKCSSQQIVSEKDGNFYCKKCQDEFSSGKTCSFCKKKLTSEFLSSPDKPGIIACKECESELRKPTSYDPNAKATCQCGKKSEPAWRWNASSGSWDHLVRILDADCCSMLTDKCKCGAEKNKEELSCSKCIERERIRQEFWQPAKS